MARPGVRKALSPPPPPPAGRTRLTTVEVDAQQAWSLRRQRSALLAKAARHGRSKMQNEMTDIKINVPVWKKIVLFSKVTAVAVVAVGLEALTVWGNPLLAVALFLLGILIMAIPVRVTVSAEGPAQG